MFVAVVISQLRQLTSQTMLVKLALLLTLSAASGLNLGLTARRTTNPTMRADAWVEDYWSQQSANVVTFRTPSP